MSTRPRRRHKPLIVYSKSCDLIIVLSHNNLFFFNLTIVAMDFYFKIMLMKYGIKDYYLDRLLLS